MRFHIFKGNVPERNNPLPPPLDVCQLDPLLPPPPIIKYSTDLAPSGTVNNI